VTSRLGEATPERGGRAKRYFTLTAAGHQALHSSRTALLSMWANVAHRIRSKARP
jgi:PadR family transcriptional regulator PadR